MKARYCEVLRRGALCGVWMLALRAAECLLAGRSCQQAAWHRPGTRAAKHSVPQVGTSILHRCCASSSVAGRVPRKHLRSGSGLCRADAPAAWAARTTADTPGVLYGV